MVWVDSKLTDGDDQGRSLVFDLFVALGARISFLWGGPVVGRMSVPFGYGLYRSPLWLSLVLKLDLPHLSVAPTYVLPTSAYISICS